MKIREIVRPVAKAALWALITMATMAGGALAQTIDFETLPGGTPMTAMSGGTQRTIHTDYQASDGVTFSLRNKVSGTGLDKRFIPSSSPNAYPHIAKVGTPMTAFQGPVASPDRDDRPATSANIGNFFLTDDGKLETDIFTLFIDYDEDVGVATGDIIDTDGPEAWKVEAYNVPDPTFSDQPVATYYICGEAYDAPADITCDYTAQEDGEAVQWTLGEKCPQRIHIRSIAISYVGGDVGTRTIGLAFDNFTADAGDCQQPSLSIEKTIDSVPWVAGGTGSATLVVTNTGGPIAPGTVMTVKDDGFLSPPLTLTGMSGPTDWDCTTTLGQCTYTVPGPNPVPTGASWPFHVAFNINPNSRATSVRNCAHAWLQDTQMPEGCANVDIVRPQPSLSIEKTALDGPDWQAGTQGSYQITVTNTGGPISSGVLSVVDNDLTSPPFVSGSLGVVPPTDWNCTPATGRCTYNGAYPVPAGQPWTFTINGLLDRDYSGGFKNCAEIQLNEERMDQSCTAVNITTPPLPPDLSLSKTALNGPWTADGTGAFVITLVNNGGAIPAGSIISLQDILPAPFSLIGIDDAPAGWSCQGAQCTYTASSVVPPVQDWNFTVNAGIDPDYPGGSVENCASASVQGPGFEPQEKKACATVQVNPACPKPLGAICGRKVNARGMALSNWIIVATNTGTSTSYPPVATDASGYYCIQNLPAGNYKVKEQIPGLLNGWVWRAVSPSGGVYPQIQVQEGKIKNGVNFKNRKEKICFNTPVRACPIRVNPVTLTKKKKDSGPDKKGKHRHKHKKSKKQGHRGGSGAADQNGDFALKACCGPIPGTENPGVPGPPPSTANDGGINISPRHDPKKFGAGGRGVLIIGVDHISFDKGGRLTLTEHLSPGLFVTPGLIRDGAWSCNAGPVSANGQDLACAYDGPPVSTTTLTLNAGVARRGDFPEGTRHVRHCVRASLGAARSGGSRAQQTGLVCDRIKVKGLKSNKLHLGIGIGIGGIGGGGKKHGSVKTRRDGP